MAVLTDFYFKCKNGYTIPRIHFKRKAHSLEQIVLGAPNVTYLMQTVFTVVLQKSIPTQIRQLILYVSISKELTDLWRS